MTGTIRALLVASGLVIASTTTRAAIIVDLTEAGASGTINGAIFQQVDPQPTGTGVINSFLRIQKNGIEEGFNTDYRPPPLDAKSGRHTRALLLSQVPEVTIDGVAYREFLLDINESSNQPLLSLNEVQIFLSCLPSPSSLSSLGTPIYQMDRGEDASVKLDYSLNSGSGSGDMLLYVPSAQFLAGHGPYVFLYSKFGEAIAGDKSKVGASAGFEEWAVREFVPPPVPEPGAISITIFTALGLLHRRRH